MYRVRDNDLAIRRWGETIKSRPLCTMAILLISAVLIAKGLGKNMSLGPVYDRNKENAFTENGIFEGEIVCVSGKVKDIRERDSYGRTYFSVIVANPEWNGELLGGMGRYVTAYVDDASNIKLGSIAEVTGKLDYFDHARNHGEFDSYDYYAGRGFLFALKDASVISTGKKYDRISQTLYLTRQRLSGDIGRIYGNVDATILRAMLLGLKEEIDPEIKESFQKNGIAHILAISGLHISFLCMTLYGICIRAGCSITVSVVVSEFFLVTYVLLVGFSPSAFRAAVMFSLFLIAGICKRSYDVISAMSFASILILIYNPGYVTDASFLLSFLAILGVGFFYKNFLENSKLLKTLSKKKPPNTKGGLLYNKIVVGIVSGGAVSFFVTMATLPVLLYSYNEIAFYSVLLNIIIVPLMSVLLVSAILSILFINIFPVLSYISSSITKLILLIYKFLCGKLENLGFGRVNLGRPYLAAIIVYYPVLIFICLYKGKNKHWLRVFGFVICLMLMSLPHWSSPQLHMLDVGQGDCFVFFSDNGHTYIFDGGSSSKTNIADKRIIPFLKYYGVKQIDGIFVSHPDIDHMNGIVGILENAGKECIKVKRVFVGKEALEEGAYHELTAAAGLTTEIYGIDDDFEMKDGNLRITCLYPSSNEYHETGNNSSLVMKLQYGDFVFLETGDVEKEGEAALMEACNSSLRDVDVLKVAHHGSSSSSGTDFIETVSPKVSLISAGKNNSYGHPHVETLDTLKENDSMIFRTDISGEVWIEIEKGGGKFRVKEYAN